MMEGRIIPILELLRDCARLLAVRLALERVKSVSGRIPTRHAHCLCLPFHRSLAQSRVDNLPLSSPLAARMLPILQQTLLITLRLLSYLGDLPTSAVSAGLGTLHQHYPTSLLFPVCPIILPYATLTLNSLHNVHIRSYFPYVSMTSSMSISYAIHPN